MGDSRLDFSTFSSFACIAASGPRANSFLRPLYFRCFRMVDQGPSSSTRTLLRLPSTQDDSVPPQANSQFCHIQGPGFCLGFPWNWPVFSREILTQNGQHFSRSVTERMDIWKHLLPPFSFRQQRATNSCFQLGIVTAFQTPRPVGYRTVRGRLYCWSFYF